MKLSKIRRTAVCIGLAGALLGALAAPALAAPANDEIGSASSISLNQPATVNTTTATSGSNDPDCFGNMQTVWYKFTPSSNFRLVAKTEGSDYDTTLGIWEGSPDSLASVGCDDNDGPNNTSYLNFQALAGHTYYLRVGSGMTGATGGNAKLTILKANRVRAILDTAAWAYVRSGKAVISGKVTCVRPASVILSIEAYSKTGSGEGSVNVNCDRSQRWQVTLGEGFDNGRVDAYVNVSAVKDGSGVRDAATLPMRACTIIGTWRSDVLRGTSGNDKICSLVGNDTIYGNGGADEIRSFDGADKVYGGGGNDRILAGFGNDSLYGGAGNDDLEGDENRDLCRGGSGRDRQVECER